jgi:hypothetical protein
MWRIDLHNRPLTMAPWKDTRLQRTQIRNNKCCGFERDALSSIVFVANPNVQCAASLWRAPTGDSLFSSSAPTIPHMPISGLTGPNNPPHAYPRAHWAQQPYSLCNKATRGCREITSSSHESLTCGNVIEIFI